jgi:hypothetical protein
LEEEVFFKENAKSKYHKSFKNNLIGLPLQYAHLHYVPSLCIKFQNPSKGSEELGKQSHFSNKMIYPGAITPFKIIGQSSPYIMHIYTI